MKTVFRFAFVGSFVLVSTNIYAGNEEIARTRGAAEILAPEAPEKRPIEDLSKVRLKDASVHVDGGSFVLSTPINLKSVPPSESFLEFKISKFYDTAACTIVVSPKTRTNDLRVQKGSIISLSKPFAGTEGDSYTIFGLEISSPNSDKVLHGTLTCKYSPFSGFAPFSGSDGGGPLSILEQRLQSYASGSFTRRGDHDK